MFFFLHSEGNLQQQHKLFSRSQIKCVCAGKISEAFIILYFVEISRLFKKEKESFF